MKDDLDDLSSTRRYEDETFIRIMIRHTTADQYPSGWRYALYRDEHRDIFAGLEHEKSV